MLHGKKQNLKLSSEFKSALSAMSIDFNNWTQLYSYLELSHRDQVGAEQGSNQQSWSYDDVLGLIQQS